MKIMSMEKMGGGGAEIERGWLKGVLDKIEVADKKEGGAKMHFSDRSLKELGRFIENIESQTQESLVVSTRCWNKNAEQLKDFKTRLEKIRSRIPELAGVLMAVNNEGEKNDMTEEGLVATKEKGELPIVPFRVENYTWTAGLNSGVALLNEIAKEGKFSREGMRVISMSFDVDLSDAEIEKLAEEIKTQRFIFTERETADRKPPITEKGEGLWEKFSNLLRNPEEANLAEISYAMRNTFNVIKLSDIVAMGGFNPACNGMRGLDDRESKKSVLKSVEFPAAGEDPRTYVKGMEDAEFFMRLFLKALKENEVSTLKDIRESFENPVTYEDKSWVSFKETERTNKVVSDMISVGLIFQGKITDKYVLPESEQDFKIS